MTDEAATPRGTGADTATWTFTDLAPGPYRVSATWRPQGNLATLAAVTLVLVIACVNAASLTLARGSRQRRDVDVEPVVAHRVHRPVSAIASSISASS